MGTLYNPNSLERTNLGMSWHEKTFASPRRDVATPSELSDKSVTLDEAVTPIKAKHEATFGHRRLVVAAARLVGMRGVRTRPIAPPE